MLPEPGRVVSYVGSVVPDGCRIGSWMGADAGDRDRGPGIMDRDQGLGVRTGIRSGTRNQDPGPGMMNLDRGE